MFDLQGRVALVTGAGQGVGAGIAKQLARAGASVAVNDLHPDRAESVVEEIIGSGGRATPAPFDVCDFDAVQAGIVGATEALGVVDILVNNAGAPEELPLEQFRDTGPASWRSCVDISLYGVMNCCRAVIDGMCEREFGRIVTISSGAGTVGLSLGLSSYAAAKGGAISFMRHLALETASLGVTANTLALGLIDNQRDPDATAHLAAQVPVGRLGRVGDVAALCLYLVSTESSWMTGQTIELNGGAATT